MKIAILCGGKGTRLSEETVVKPKPMIEIGERPILWHIMMHYYAYGYKDFVIALGYKGELIKEYLMNYSSLHSNLTVCIKKGIVQIHDAEHNPDWTVQLIDTGLETLTGGRIKRLAPYLKNETFMLTWGDGVSNVNLDELLKFHRSHGKLATLTAVRPPSRFGHLEINGDKVKEFSEKPQTSEGWINGAYFILEPAAIDYIGSDDVYWERGPMQRLAQDGQLMAYKHTGFWQCMDTLRDKTLLNELWDSGNVPWKVWK